MTLRERIKKDLKELRSRKGEISDAKRLSDLMEADRIERAFDQFHFSTRGNPSHFFGNPKAKTVLVMLNPFNDWIECDRNGVADRRRRLQLPLKKDIDSYITDLVSYGKKHYPQTGSFDLKQAAFLKPWPDSGATIHPDFPETSNKEIKAETVRSVLSDKLQLELIPYCSSRFDTEFFREDNCVSRLEPIVPFLETVLDEIVRKKRKYVVFCSNVFETLFKVYEDKHPGTFTGLDPEPITDNGDKKWHCRGIWIHYKNHDQPALIAHTFPSYGLRGGGRHMVDYGRFCFQHFPRADAQSKRKTKKQELRHVFARVSDRIALP